MPRLAAGRPFSSRTPSVKVENRLAPGSYRFQLVVIDNAGNKSAPAHITVKVVERRQIDRNILRRRTDIRDALGRRIVTPIRPLRPIRPPR